MRMGVVGPFGRGGQPQAERGDGAGGRQAVGRAGQVVAFVEDDESKPVAQAVHVQIGRVVGRHGERLDVVVAAAEQADLDAEAQRELVVPLVHQVDGRGDDQGGPAGPLDGHVGQVGLAGSGRQDDHAPAAGVPPGFQPLDLVRERLLGDLEPPRRRLVSTARRPCTAACASAGARRSCDTRSPRRGTGGCGSRTSRPASWALRPRSGPRRPACPRRRAAASAGPGHRSYRQSSSSARFSRCGWPGPRWRRFGAQPQPAEQLGDRQTIPGKDGIASEDAIGR